MSSSIDKSKRAKPDPGLPTPKGTIKILIRSFYDEERFCILEFVPNDSETSLLEIYSCTDDGGHILCPEYDDGLNADVAVISYLLYKYNTDEQWTKTDPLLRDVIEELNARDEEAATVLSIFADQRRKSYDYCFEIGIYENYDDFVRKYLKKYVKFLRRAREGRQDTHERRKASEFVKGNKRIADHIDRLNDKELGIEK